VEVGEDVLEVAGTNLVQDENWQCLWLGIEMGAWAEGLHVQPGEGTLGFLGGLCYPSLSPPQVEYEL
jgi:hypothetical protein